MVSVIIPSRQERFLNPTINDVLKNATGEIEVFVILDGYEPEEFVLDSRVKYLRLPWSQTMQKRIGINAAVALARGEFVMALDAHCMVGPGFDEILSRDCDENWVVIPRRYKLEPESWTTKKDGTLPVDYEYWLKHEFNLGYLKPYRWDGRAIERKNIMIDDTMTFQGSCWFMRKTYFQKMGFMKTEGYTGWGQEDVELAMETWTTGGRVVVNKSTWYAHLYKGKTYGRMYRENPGQHKASRAYAFQKWCIEKRCDFFGVLQMFDPIPNWDSNLIHDEFEPIGGCCSEETP